jgi:drug/metabolite transporter (DMT)-like permease
MSSLQSREWAGIILALVTAVAFALSNASASLAYQSGSNPLTVAAFRFVLPTVALVIWLRMRGLPLTLPGRNGWIAAVLGAVTGVYTWALLSAIGTIPLALAILVFYLFPLVTTLVLVICGWEKLGWPTIAAIVVAFVGLALALDPHGGNLNLVGVAYAAAAAVALGTVIAVSSRVIRTGDSRPVTLYMAAVAGALLIVFCLVRGGLAWPQTGLGWAGFIGTSVLYAFAMIAFFIAISMIGAIKTSLLSYAEPIVAAALGVVMLGETLGPIQIAGIALVVAALVAATLWQPRAH